MFSRGLLLVLLVLACLQSFTSAQSKGPNQCCMNYQSTKLPLKAIKKYKATELQCTRPGFIFTTRKDVDVCANPNDEWVQKLVNQFNEQMLNSQE